MSGLALGLALAAVASVALNAGYVIQHVGSADAPPVDARRPVATLRGLFASRVWLLGGVLGMTGWALHVWSISMAPLSLVQAFVAGGLGLMAPIASRALGERLATVDRMAVGAIVVALALLCVGLHDSGAHGHVHAARLAVFLAGGAAVAAALSTARGAWRSHALGLVGGWLYGAADVAIKGITGVASSHGLGTALLSPWLAAAALLTAGAFFGFQRGLQTGHAVPVIVLMTAATTVCSILGGLVVFGDPLGRTPALAALHLFAFGLVTLAAAALARALAYEPRSSDLLNVEQLRA
jgi:hypothetical protein